MGIPKIGGAPRLAQDLARDQEFNLNVAMGMYPGYNTVAKFGENPEIDTNSTPEDVWEGGGLYTYDAVGTAPIVSLISSDPADIGHIISVQGLDINGDVVNRVVLLNGTTRVALPIPLWRVFRMVNLSLEATGTPAGTVYCYVGTGGVPSLANTRAIITTGNNQTLMALYTIPRNKVGFIFHAEVGASRGVSAAEVRIAIYTRPYRRVFAVKKRINVSNSGSSIYQDERTFPDSVPGLSDLRLTVESTSANDIGVFATFDLLYADESLFPESFLRTIGQPGYGI